MIQFRNIADLVALAEKNGKPLSDIIWEWETERSECLPDRVWKEMQSRLNVMKQAVTQGLNQQKKSLSGLTGGDACKLAAANSFIGPIVAKASAYAIAVSEVNASMGRIVACPTAGSCGIVPGSLFAVCDFLHCSDDVLIRALFTAAGIGQVIADNATVSGAVGGCQANIRFFQFPTPR